MTVDSAKWKANVDFLYGDEDQMPHPTLEAITGVGNTPAYRGMCIAVFKNFDVSSAGDRIPQFQFVVGTATTSTIAIPYTDDFKYRVEEPGSSADYSSPSYDDSAWTTAPGGFGNSAVVTWLKNTYVASGVAGRAIWVRKTIPKTWTGGTLTIQTNTDDGAWLWVNGVPYQSSLMTGGTVTVDLSTVTGDAVIVLKAVDSVPSGTPSGIFAGMNITFDTTLVGKVSLSGIVSNICRRGGLGMDDFDLSHLPDRTVDGYLIASKSNAADCLLPVLQAYFAFASEYDAKLYFHPYGDDATIDLATDNLIERSNSGDGLVTYNTRKQETEFPQRIVATYYDPAQNYKPVNVTSRRRASTVKAIGDQAFQIPVAMPATDAVQAADKAMKVAYATLQGTVELTVPFADSDCYLSLPSGFPLTFNGKRYVIDEAKLSHSTIDLTLRYDRQSAYTSNVQPVLGNAPSTPDSRYSGPTKLIVMNLPAQRPQDSLGVYLAAGSSDGRTSWLGCDVQVSYDGQATWQQAVQILTESTIGSFMASQPSGGEPLSVSTLKFDLDSATAPQLAALANAFAAVLTDGSGTAQLGQFATATETSSLHFSLTSVSRALGGVPTSAIANGQDFTLMESAYFLPIDATMKGRTIYFRAVGFGEVAEDQPIVSIVYTALTRPIGITRLTEAGVQRLTEDGITSRFTES
jgi:hypothetical protein